MGTWEQILYAVMLVAILFFVWPGVKASIARSKQSQEKHWGTFALIVIALIAFVALLISSVQ
jgi:hypothetical protein